MTETCRICRKTLHPFPMGEKNGYLLTGCKLCGSVFTEPDVTQEALDAAFTEVRPEIVHLHAHDLEIGAIKKQVKKILPHVRGKRLIDACCRHGYGVAAARELELEATGLDARDFFIAFARENYGAQNFVHATAAAHAAAGHKADIILAREAFCSEPDLDGFTGALAKMLAPGGKILVEEPDGNSFWLPHDFSRWSVVDPPLSFHFLSRKGMHALLARHGLAVEQRLFMFGARMRMIVSKTGDSRP